MLSARPRPGDSVVILTPEQKAAAYRWAYNRRKQGKPGTEADWIALHLTPEGTLGKKHQTSKYGPPGHFDEVLARRHRAYCVRNNRPDAPFEEYLEAVERWQEHQRGGKPQISIKEKTQEILRKKGLLPTKEQNRGH